MKLALPEIQTVFQIDDVPYVNTVVIENQELLWRVVEDLSRQCEGLDGRSILSKKNTPINIKQNLELIDNFVSFDLNTRTLLTKITTALEKVAVDEAHYIATQKLLTEIEKSVYDWAFDFPCSIIPAKISAGTLLKSVGVELSNDYQGSAGAVEKLIDYMELVREFDRDKLFVLVNLRGFFGDGTAERLMETALSHGYRVFMLENREYALLPKEKRLVVDRDLCEI